MTLPEEQRLDDDLVVPANSIKTASPKVDDRAASIHAAKVYLAQSRHFSRRNRAFSFALLTWAANARRRAMAFKPAAPAQSALF